MLGGFSHHPGPEPAHDGGFEDGGNLLMMDGKGQKFKQAQKLVAVDESFRTKLHRAMPYASRVELTVRRPYITLIS